MDSIRGTGDPAEALSATRAALTSAINADQLLRIAASDMRLPMATRLRLRRASDSIADLRRELEVAERFWVNRVAEQEASRGT